MPIRQFIKIEMGSAEINRLNIAYAKALRMFGLLDRGGPLTNLIGKKIVEVGKSGVTDPQKITDIVVWHFHRP